MSTFTLTLKLKNEPFQEERLTKRLDMGRQMYNACLGELHKRYRTFQQSKEYDAVYKMSKGKDRNK